LHSKCKKRLVRLFLFILFIPNIFISASTHHSRGSDFRGFLIAGDRFIEGRFLYEDSRVATNVTWPPFFAIFITPFSLLARLNLPLTQVIWYIINALLFLFTIDIWCRLFYERPIGWFSENKPHSFYSLSIFIPLVLIAQSVFKVFVPLQLNILVLFLMSLSFLHLKEEKNYLSGFWLGLISAIKVFPVLALPYFIYRRKFKALFVCVVTGLVLTLGPILRYGWGDYLHNLQVWIQISLSGGYPLGGLNQSMYAMIGRWVASSPFIIMSQKLPTPPLDSLGSIAALWLYRGFYILLLGIFFYWLYKQNYRFLAMEAAFMIVLAMLFSPIAWRNYWIITFPGYFVLYNLYLKDDAKDKVLFYSIWISFFLVTVLQVVGQIIGPLRGFFMCVISNQTLGALLLLFALLYYIREKKEENVALLG
jgi:hypothetical protein